MGAAELQRPRQDALPAAALVCLQAAAVVPVVWARSGRQAAGDGAYHLGLRDVHKLPTVALERPTSTRAIFCQPASTVNKGPTGANTTIATPRPRPRSFRGLLVRRGCQQHRNTTRRRWRTLTRCGAPRGLLPTAHASACLSGALPGLGGANGTRNGWVGCAKATPQARRTGTRNVTARGGAAAGSVAPTLAFGAPSISSRCPLVAHCGHAERGGIGPSAVAMLSSTIRLF